MVHHLRKLKNCWQVIAITQASITAPTLTVMQGFEAKKKTASCISLPVPYTPYSSIPRNRNPSANRWWEAEHDNHYTTQLATMQ